MSWRVPVLFLFGLLALIMFVGSSPTANATTTNSPAYPNQRWGGGFTYYTKYDYFLLFSGSDGAADTWIYYPSNNVWVSVTTQNSPEARTNACMAYDGRTENIILFGGIGAGGAYLNDTWSYRDGTWINITSQSPAMPGIAYSACAYDPSKTAPGLGANGILMFGGSMYNYSTGDFTQAGGETWNFTDTGSWKLLSPPTSPPGRSGASMEYDLTDNYFVMYGGANTAVGGTNYLNDTWEYNGITWTNITSTSYASGSTKTPPNRWEAVMTRYYNGTTNSVMLFGGQLNKLKNNATVSGHSAQNQTWRFYAGKWYNVTPTGSKPNPGTRFDMEASFGYQSNVVVEFSGLSATAVNSPLRDDVWQYFDGNWIPMTNSIVFQETGLIPPTPWYVTVNPDQNTSSYNITYTFSRPNGNYVYNAHAPHGYAVSPSSGNIVVNSVTPKILLTYTPTSVQSCTSFEVSSSLYSTTTNQLCTLTSNQVLNLSVGAGNSGSISYKITNMTSQQVVVSNTATTGPNGYCIGFVRYLKLGSGTYNVSITTGSGTGNCGVAAVTLNTYFPSCDNLIMSSNTANTAFSDYCSVASNTIYNVSTAPGNTYDAWWTITNASTNALIQGSTDRAATGCRPNANVPCFPYFTQGNNGFCIGFDGQVLLNPGVYNVSVNTGVGGGSCGATELELNKLKHVPDCNGLSFSSNTVNTWVRAYCQAKSWTIYNLSVSAGGQGDTLYRVADVNTSSVSVGAGHTTSENYVIVRQMQLPLDTYNISMHTGGGFEGGAGISIVKAALKQCANNALVSSNYTDYIDSVYCNVNATAANETLNLSVAAGHTGESLYMLAPALAPIYNAIILASGDQYNNPFGTNDYCLANVQQVVMPEGVYNLSIIPELYGSANTPCNAAAELYQFTYPSCATDFSITLTSEGQQETQDCSLLSDTYVAISTATGYGDGITWQITAINNGTVMASGSETGSPYCLQQVAGVLLPPGSYSVYAKAGSSSGGCQDPEIELVGSNVINCNGATASAESAGAVSVLCTPKAKDSGDTYYLATAVGDFGSISYSITDLTNSVTIVSGAETGIPGADCLTYITGVTLDANNVYSLSIDPSGTGGSCSSNSAAQIQTTLVLPHAPNCNGVIDIASTSATENTVYCAADIADSGEFFNFSVLQGGAGTVDYYIWNVANGVTVATGTVTSTPNSAAFEFVTGVQLYYGTTYGMSIIPYGGGAQAQLSTFAPCYSISLGTKTANIAGNGPWEICSWDGGPMNISEGYGYYSSIEAQLESEFNTPSGYYIWTASNTTEQYGTTTSPPGCESYQGSWIIPAGYYNFSIVRTGTSWVGGNFCGGAAAVLNYPHCNSLNFIVTYGTGTCVGTAGYLPLYVYDGPYSSIGYTLSDLYSGNEVATGIVSYCGQLPDVDMPGSSLYNLNVGYTGSQSPPCPWTGVELYPGWLGN